MARLKPFFLLVTLPTWLDNSTSRPSHRGRDRRRQETVQERRLLRCVYTVGGIMERAQPEQNPVLLSPVYRTLRWARASLGMGKKPGVPESGCLKRGYSHRSQRWDVNASHRTPPPSVPEDGEAPDTCFGENFSLCSEERERETASKSIADFSSHQLVSRFEPMSTNLEFRSCK